MNKHLQIKIKGRVQGVFFRVSTREQALALGLKGYAENLPDGTVLVEAEGREEDLRKFLDWCKHGPDQARVDEIGHEFSEVLKGFEDFEVK